MKSIYILLTLLLALQTGCIAIWEPFYDDHEEPPPAPLCGDGILDVGEECDGVNTGGLGCWDLGFTGGYLACTYTCQLDFSYCEDEGICGDGIAD